MERIRLGAYRCVWDYFVAFDTRSPRRSGQVPAWPQVYERANGELKKSGELEAPRDQRIDSIKASDARARNGKRAPLIHSHDYGHAGDHALGKQLHANQSGILKIYPIKGKIRDDAVTRI